MKSVADAKGKVLAANSLCSNSGFHVLRHELKTVFNGSIEDYFCKIHYTGSHHLSIQSILEGVSEFAAIDAATYEYLCVIDPVYRTQLRIIGQSRQSTAPPLVTHKNSPFCDPQLLTNALNSALNSLDQVTRNTLNIRQFHKVKLGDYTSQLLD
jgi:ABC-type phosphate/phosphonate transport system substrate-binding protein